MWRKHDKLNDFSNPENLGVARFDLLALRLHGNRIGFEHFHF
jgi:hypothetical protein